MFESKTSTVQNGTLEQLLTSDWVRYSNEIVLVDTVLPRFENSKSLWLILYDILIYGGGGEGIY